jgi:hypothetical protein
MNRLRNIIYLAVLLCSGCVKTASIPPADLTLSSLGLGPDNLFTAHFNSTVDLESAFNDYENANQLTPTLICSLDRSIDRSRDGVLVGAFNRCQS